jgi:hypothetical protein
MTLIFCAVALAAVPKAGHYTGSTSGQGKTVADERDRSVNFKVSATAKKVTAFKVGYKATCPSGADLEEGADEIHGSFVIKNGRFSGTGHLGGQGTGTVTGRFTSSKTATGTVHLQPINDNTAGEDGGTTPAESCDSGTLKWSAHLG